MFGLRGVTFTTVTVVLFTAMVLNSFWSLYSLFRVPLCALKDETACIRPYYGPEDQLDLRVYISTMMSPATTSTLSLVLHEKKFFLTETWSKTINVSLPDNARYNRTLYLHIFICPRGKSPLQPPSNIQSIHAIVPQTTHAIPESTAFNLVGGSSELKQEDSVGQYRPVSHWHPHLNIHSVTDRLLFDRMTTPNDVWMIVKPIPSTRFYLPVLYVDQLSVLQRHMKLMEKSDSVKELQINYSPMSLGMMRLLNHFTVSLNSMKTLGFSDKDLDELKGIFVDTNIYLLALTFFISFFHLLFDFLAFKNDISYWRKRKTMVGLSTRVVLWRCFSQAVIFLYLLDEDTSLLVLIPAGIGSVIEIWKVTRALKLKFIWTGFWLKIERGKTTKNEEETASFDSQAMGYLSYLLWPLVLGGAVYSLLYVAHRSWYSWVINSLVNGVYAFGFLFMLPQLFVNYKLKSVAHLPWRAFMYKAFNTFIDDVFAFIITMPTSHRVAVFRDDVVFVVYLYQRWLYPVDKARVNEFGESLEDTQKHKSD
ncbi:lipid scramblase CLPTM1L-like [Dysidea avara]|uniref:lipid scramblase CLPTM1L-like n=1 Tax=Dysidea avara TaxID=196820 RepID=UPI00332D1B8C